MYIIENAFKNVTRSKGRNILIGVIIIVITTCTCIALSINKAGEKLVDNYYMKNPLEISLNLDMKKLREADDDVKNGFESLKVSDIKNYGDSDLVKDYYYTLESNINGKDIEVVDDNIELENSEDNNFEKPNNNNDMKMKSFGDFRITAYSNFSYLNDFTNGNKKIKEGSMVTGASTDNEIVISNDLASKNNLRVGDSITLTIPNNENVEFEYKIIGIYENITNDSSNNFMGINALNSANQIYTNLVCLEDILNQSETNSNSKRLVANNGLSAKFYLNNNNDLGKFEDEIRKKGLSEYYQIVTNEDEMLSTLKPIENIKNFSHNFLIVIIIIGIMILTLINFLNIRDRKHEIGILRSIGMSKIKVTIQLILELLMISTISLISGTILGILLMKPVTSQMLESEITSYKEEKDKQLDNFGMSGFEKPSEGFNKEINPRFEKNYNIDYVDNLDVKLDITTLIAIILINILLTLLSVITSSIMINKYSPNKILQNRN